MHILIAPNAFKNSLPAEEVASAIREGLQQSKLGCSIECFPIGDGGDGTAGLIIEKHRGTTVEVNVHDPLGRNISSRFGLIDNDQTAVIELAGASGIGLLRSQEMDPMHATTFGTGELVRQALDKKVRKIIICIGGSATVDGGTGILQALGIRFLDNNNTVLNSLPEDLSKLAAIDLSELDQRILNCEVIILCDVENFLLGERGAAKIFGPQKGASPLEVELLENALSTLRGVALKETGKDMAVLKHGGAAGGVAAGLCVLCNAQLVNGIDYFLHITGFEKALRKADLVITGEGIIDAQTLQGKGPYGVALKAKEKNIPVIGIAGKIQPSTDGRLQEYFDALFTINQEPFEIEMALKNTKANLVKTGKAIGDLLAKEVHHQ